MRLGIPGLLAAALLLAGPLNAQPPGVQSRASDQEMELSAREEATAIRRAAGLEWRGDLDGAENVLTALLASKPNSTGALFALERVSRSRDRLHQVLPYADAYLGAEPGSGGIRALKLRVLAEVDSVSALRPEVDAWVNQVPDSEEPWREAARIWEEVFGMAAAEDLLREAREELDDDGALAVEIGVLHAEAGDAPGAIAEWAVAVRRPGADLPRMRRRLAGLDGDPVVWVGPMLEALSGEEAGPELRRAGVQVALELGLHDRARSLAEAAVTALRGPPRTTFLDDIVQQADASGAPDVVLWGLVRLRADAASAAAPGLDVRIASAALAVGDTALALEAQTRLARSLPPGSEERRRVIADLIRVESRQGAPGTLRQRYTGFRTEFPTAPELDELAALVASGIAGAGEASVALELLGDPTPGPRSMLERGYLRLSSGESEGGVADLEAALSGLAPERATEVIQLLTGMQRTSPAGAAALATAEAEAHWGLHDAALETVRAALESVPPEDRAVLLAAAARHALDAEDDATAEVFLDAVVGGFPEAPERPEAMLRLAQVRADQPGGRDDAVRLLEELIVEGPERSVVPAARRVLQRLREPGFTEQRLREPAP